MGLSSGGIPMRDWRPRSVKRTQAASRSATPQRNGGRRCPSHACERIRQTGDHRSPRQTLRVRRPITAGNDLGPQRRFLNEQVHPQSRGRPANCPNSPALALSLGMSSSAACHSQREQPLMLSGRADVRNDVGIPLFTDALEAENRIKFFAQICCRNKLSGRQSQILSDCCQNPLSGGIAHSVSVMIYQISDFLEID